MPVIDYEWTHTGVDIIVKQKKIDDIKIKKISIFFLKH